MQIKEIPYARIADKSRNVKRTVFAALFVSLTGCDFSDSFSSGTSPTPITDSGGASEIAPGSTAQNPQSGVSGSAPPNPAFTEETEAQSQSLGAATNAAGPNQRFGDRFWAELAQDYPPFTPEPDTGFANGNDQPELVGQWEPLVDWPLIASGAVLTKSVTAVCC